MKLNKDLMSALDHRKDFGPGYAYKIFGGQSPYGMSTDFADGISDIDENEMSVTFPYASGVRRDGVGDLLEIGGIKLDRHRKNPAVLLDHGKHTVLPIGMAEDPNRVYTVHLDTNNKVATCKAYFYQSHKNYDHSVLCDQIFDMVAKRYIRGGSIGYQVLKAYPLQPDYNTGVPQGMHLQEVLQLEVSLVVMPANQDTVMKMLSFKRVCGKPLSPVLVKSLMGCGVAPKPKAQMLVSRKSTPEERVRNVDEKSHRKKPDPFRVGDEVAFIWQHPIGGHRIMKRGVVRPGGGANHFTVEHEELGKVRRDTVPREHFIGNITQNPELFEKPRTEEDVEAAKEKNELIQDMRGAGYETGPRETHVPNDKSPIDLGEDAATNPGIVPAVPIAEAPTRADPIRKNKSLSELKKRYRVKSNPQEIYPPSNIPKHSHPSGWGFLNFDPELDDGYGVDEGEPLDLGIDPDFYSDEAEAHELMDQLGDVEEKARTPEEESYDRDTEQDNRINRNLEEQRRWMHENGLIDIHGNPINLLAEYENQESKGKTLFQLKRKYLGEVREKVAPVPKRGERVYIHGEPHTMVRPGTSRNIDVERALGSEGLEDFHLVRTPENSRWFFIPHETIGEGSQDFHDQPLEEPEGTENKSFRFKDDFHALGHQLHLDPAGVHPVFSDIVEERGAPPHINSYVRKSPRHAISHYASESRPGVYFENDFVHHHPTNQSAVITDITGYEDDPVFHLTFVKEPNNEDFLHLHKPGSENETTANLGDFTHHALHHNRDFFGTVA